MENYNGDSRLGSDRDAVFVEHIRNRQAANPGDTNGR